VKFATFHRNILDARPNRLKCDSTYWEIFHSRPHDDNCEYLESRGTSAYTIAFSLHLMLGGVGLYVAKNDAEVIIHDTAQFKGSRAIQELVLHLVVAGQDNDRLHYKNEGHGWVHALQGGLAQRAVRVPGIDISQLSRRNQDALRYVYPILKHVKVDEMPMRCKALTSKGAFKDKPFPTDFLFAPAFLDGWPMPLVGEGPPENTMGSRQRSHFNETAAEEDSDNESDESEADDSFA